MPPSPMEVFADTSWLDGLEALKGFFSLKANESDLSDMAKVIEIVTKAGV